MTWHKQPTTYLRPQKQHSTLKQTSKSIEIKGFAVHQIDWTKTISKNNRNENGRERGAIHYLGEVRPCETLKQVFWGESQRQNTTLISKKYREYKKEIRKEKGNESREGSFLFNN